MNHYVYAVHDDLNSSRPGVASSCSSSPPPSAPSPRRPPTSTHSSPDRSGKPGTTPTTTSPARSWPAPAPAPSPSAPARHDPSITFSTVIDSDHATINAVATRLRRATTAASRAQLLREVTWRLVRHDVSEELVMRPAFVAHMGAEGVRLAEHDRGDHERAKTELLALFDAPLDGPDFSVVIGRLFADLLEHMKVESGEQIPALERRLDPVESQRLGREYLHTQVLTPDLELADPGTGVPTRVWRDVDEYVRTDLTRFHAIWEQFNGSDGAGGATSEPKGKL